MYVCADGKQKSQPYSTTQSLYFIEQTQNIHQLTVAIRSLIIDGTVNTIGDQ